MLAPSTVRSTRQQITDAIRDDLLSGKIPVGEKITEESLSTRFGVSRGPVREAISQLASEGLLLARPNCGVTVAPPASEEIRELILPMRLSLELFALRKCFAALDATDFQVWDDLLFQMHRACKQANAAAYPQLDLAIHAHLMKRASDQNLFDIWQAIVLRMRSHFWETARAAASGKRMNALYTHHEELIAAFRAGPKSAAVKALEEHIRDN